jgi:arabinose-5-phosphate isomerase
MPDPHPTSPSDPASAPSDFVRTEARALEALAARLDGPMRPLFERAVQLVAGSVGTHARVVVTGMGKSGIIAQKIAATLSSTGTPALFLHPAEAIHGDIGMLAPGDVVLALSASGETAEILRLLAQLKRIGDALISFCCDLRSTLAQASDVALDCSVSREACSLNLAPTASTTVMLALGDALAMAVAERRGFRPEDFANLHPGGKLGKQLARVEDLMHAGDLIPRVSPSAAMPDVIYEMSRKKLGVTTVIADDQTLLGLLSDGDLRRLLESKGAATLELTAAQAMNSAPVTIAPHELGVTALHIMEERRITSLVVVDADRRVRGVLHLHDLWTTEMF